MTKSEENQERLGDLSDHYVGLTLVKESGKESSLSGRILGSRVGLKEVQQGQWEGSSSQRCPSKDPFLTQVWTCFSLSDVLRLGWEQPVGRMASALTPGWISQPSIRDFSQWHSCSGRSERCILTATLHTISGTHVAKHIKHTSVALKS